MPYIILAILLLVASIGGFFVASLILLWVSRLFKVGNITFKSSMMIILVYVIFSSLLGLVLSLLNLGIISTIISLIVCFFVFSYLLKKYQVNWKKALGIYVSLIVINSVISLCIILPVRLFVMQPFYVKGDTMSPSLQDKDYLMVNMINKDFNRGDIVVFKYPKDPTQFFIKRIIGLPGDKIEIKDGKVLINGNQLDEKYLTAGTETILPLRGYGKMELGSGEYFLLGDNRDKSLDSRIFGLVDKSLIVGKIWFQLFPKFQEFK